MMTPQLIETPLQVVLLDWNENDDAWLAVSLLPFIHLRAMHYLDSSEYSKTEPIPIIIPLAIFLAMTLAMMES